VEEERLKTVLITGSEGFIGRNLRSHLGLRQDLGVVGCDVADSRAELLQKARSADFVVHLAGVNRPANVTDFDSVNRGLTEELTEILSARGGQTPVILASSTQATRDNPYGKSKHDAEEAVRRYGQGGGARVFIFRLPNVFGKWCRPNYNSVVATWCHNSTRGLPICIDDPSAEIELAHVDDVARSFMDAIDGALGPSPDGFCRVTVTYQRTLAAIAGAINSFVESRSTLVLPDLGDAFQRKLYGTWLSYLAEDDFAYSLDMKRDPRGWLAEFIKSDSSGQLFVSKTLPGITRGNHWHHQKVEKFLVIQGKAVVRMRKVDGGGIIEYPVQGDALRVVDIPPGYTHSITNIGEEPLLTLFWADEIFDPKAPDTHALGVEQ
jgi:UDP-2-acetamido-2,6-beta-L-arabino-hexul-4-ose reductase